MKTPKTAVFRGAVVARARAASDGVARDYCRALGACGAYCRSDGLTLLFAEATRSTKPRDGGPWTCVRVKRRRAPVVARALRRFAPP